ncbi:MAG: tetratricopeptide repeat protein [Chloroflexota bacterium]
MNGRYLLHEKIGQGGMGIVHRATDRLTGEAVALKQVFLPINDLLFASNPISRAQHNLRLALANEFQLLASMRHPHIISVLDYGFGVEKRPFFTMSYLEKAQTILEAGNGRSSTAKIDLLLQTLEALAYLHRRAVLHRDLKPGNVLVANNRIRVLDFGLSATKEQATASVGSWQYMAPEVLQGGTATEQADLYAVGILAFQLFAQEHPFNLQATDQESFFANREPHWQKLRFDGQLAAGAAASVEAIIRALLANDPAQRPQTAAETMQGLQAALGRSPAQETAVRHRQLAIRESYLQAATFVGREAEMSQLTAALSEAQAGQGSAWLIGGESGIGKSRLINELRTQALVAGFQVLRGQTVEEGGLPYQVWREPMRHLVATLPEIDALAASVLLPLVPDIAQLLGSPVQAAPELQSNAAQTRLFTTMARLLRQAKRPLLLILEDLHLDAASLLPLPYLTRSVKQHKLLLLGSYRSDEHPSLPNALSGMNHLPLERLSAAAMATLSEAMLGDVGRSKTLQSLLQRETEGNAFFAVEVVRALAEEAGQLTAIDQTTLPQSLMSAGIQSVITRRLTQVPLRAHRLLTLAAVAGRQLDLAVIRRLAADIDVDNWWLPICTDAAILEVQDNQWQFRHTKLRHGLLARPTPAQLQTNHAKVAAVVEALYGADDAHASQLAFHWGQAKQPEQEATYTLRAGLYAEKQGAMSESVRLLMRAYRLTPANQLAQRFKILKALWEPIRVLGDMAQQDRMLQESASLSAALEQPDRQAEIASWLAVAARESGNFDLAQRHAQQAITYGQVNGNHSLLGRVYSTYASIYSRKGDFDEALTTARQAVTLAKLGDDETSLSSAWLNLGVIEQTTGNYDAALEANRHGGDLAKKRNRHWDQVVSLNNSGLVYYSLGKYTAAQQCYEEALALCEQTGNLAMECIVLINLGNIQLRQGIAAAATASFRRGLTLSQEINSDGLKGYAQHYLGDAALLASDYATAHACYQQALHIRQAMGQAYLEVETQAAFAHLARLQGQDFRKPLASVVTYLQQNPALNGAEHPMRVYLTAYHCLQKVDLTEANRLLAQGFQQLQKLAANIQSTELQTHFLQNVAEHQEIVRLYETG